MAGLPAITFLGLKGAAAWVAAGVATAGAVGVASKVMPALFGSSSGSGATASSKAAGPAPGIDQLLSALKAGGDIGTRGAALGLSFADSVAGASLGLAGDVTGIAGDVARAETGAIVATNATLGRIVEKATPAAVPLTVQGPTLGSSPVAIGRGGAPLRITPTPPPTAVIAPPPVVVDAPRRLTEDLAVPAGGAGAVIPKGAVVQDVVIAGTVVPISLSADALARGGLN